MAKRQGAVHVKVELRKLAAFRLAVYDPCDDEDTPEFIGPVFRDVPFDRLVMELAIKKFYRRIAKRDCSHYCMAAFPWEETQ